MIQRGGSNGFLLKAAQAVGVLRNRFGQDLERDFAAQSFIFGEIHFAHAARAEFRRNAIV